MKSSKIIALYALAASLCVASAANADNIKIGNGIHTRKDI